MKNALYFILGLSFSVIPFASAGVISDVVDTVKEVVGIKYETPTTSEKIDKILEPVDEKSDSFLIRQAQRLRNIEYLNALQNYEIKK